MGPITNGTAGARIRRAGLKELDAGRAELLVVGVFIQWKVECHDRSSTAGDLQIDLAMSVFKR